ncbi:tubulin-specific chaperone A isoform X3 [Microtus pennsylvanicus]|uniref:tubulin-specific chaperone A isoform X3 n=1 Tax=Microtus pennsylvanicus TaxID=10058 RepID=UPI003F6C810C
MVRTTPLRSRNPSRVPDDDPRLPAPVRGCIYRSSADTTSPLWTQLCPPLCAEDTLSCDVASQEMGDAIGFLPESEKDLEEAEEYKEARVVLDSVKLEA